MINKYFGFTHLMNGIWIYSFTLTDLMVRVHERLGFFTDFLVYIITLFLWALGMLFIDKGLRDIKDQVYLGN